MELRFSREVVKEPVFMVGFPDKVSSLQINK